MELNDAGPAVPVGGISDRELWARAVDGDREAAVRGESRGRQRGPRIQGEDAIPPYRGLARFEPADAAKLGLPAADRSRQQLGRDPQALSAFDCGIQVILLAPYSAVWQPLTTGSLRQRARPALRS
jgi:hypothetical protein